MPARFPEVLDRGTSPRSQVNGTSDRWSSEDEIIISGISGRFPESDSMEEFKQQLLDGIDLVTDDDRRWPAGK